MDSDHTGERAGPTPFGPFLLEKRLAVGGSAEVFLALPKRGDRPAPRFVVKRLLPSNQKDEQFGVLGREAELHRAVVHPNVVTVYGAGMVGDEPYLAMEYVEGLDLYRLLRRAESEQRRMPVGLATYIARQLCDALGAVHAACDDSGNPLHIVHRDVTPSNIYLSLDGSVKLGDFGIARVRQHTGPAQPSAGLKGKFGYLAPEQVAGEPFDHRADLFAMAAVFGEMLIGARIFPGSGQLAVLLAIRDVNIEPLRRASPPVDAKLMAVCEHALARDPDQRFGSAAELSAALAPFQTPTDDELRQELSEWVGWARDSTELARQLEGRIRDSMQRMRAVDVGGSADAASEHPDTGLSQVLTVSGRTYEDVPFSRLIEMIATGELMGDDKVALMGSEFCAIQEIEELARHLLPSTSATTGRLFQPGVPDYRAQLAQTPMLDVLAHLRATRESGALFVERRDATGAPRRKELYLGEGRLTHVASTDRNELLGEYLVRRRALSRQQLDEALSALSRFGGRLGDTLISMGMVDAVDVFRAIRNQGRDRVAAMCGWPRANVTFYRGTLPARVEFPLDLDLASPIMAGTYVTSHGKPRSLLPRGDVRLLPGPRAGLVSDSHERGTAPVSLQLVAGLMEEPPTVDGALARIAAHHPTPNSRVISLNEAAAALVTAKHLGWVAYPSDAPPASST